MRDCTYLTHPEVLVAPEIPVPDWSLSPKGRERAFAFLRQPFLRSVRHIFSSAEKKALETAAIIVQHLNVEVVTDADMHENDRSSTGFLPPEEFEKMADAFFASPEESVGGWEPALLAQQRIVTRVTSAIDSLRTDGAALFVGHGAVGTLLKCHLMSLPIDRAQDQPAGGGHFFRFSSTWLTARQAHPLPWRRMEIPEA
ncbi:histidine phosphatase family protein [Stappia sp. GBMRC 2046]|uniref:Histidine phosphatase family protein n=1 Tax=Stappia sediminis TaxID=2692190 RepID=A0A7X3LXE9_9HYPH|nr:histidine phosphatase family protein [Stappia sediminis]MXN66848.1 histidine phosphatase family protein [Stappia sediminis]